MARLDEGQIEAGLARLEGWSREGDAISKRFERGDFVGSVEFVRSLVGPAEQQGHHPDLEISWGTVTVTLTTHSEGGLTAADLDMAERVDALA